MCAYKKRAALLESRILLLLSPFCLGRLQFTFGISRGMANAGLGPLLDLLRYAADVAARNACPVDDRAGGSREIADNE